MPKPTPGLGKALEALADLIDNGHALAACAPTLFVEEVIKHVKRARGRCENCKCWRCSDCDIDIDDGA